MWIGLLVQIVFHVIALYNVIIFVEIINGTVV